MHKGSSHLDDASEDGPNARFGSLADIKVCPHHHALLPCHSQSSDAVRELSAAEISKPIAKFVQPVLQLGLESPLPSVCLFTGFAFVTAVESVNFAKRQLGVALARQDTKCTLGSLDEITKNYAPDLIARQVAYKINNDSLKSHTYFAPLAALGKDLALAARLKPDLDPTWVLMAKLPWLVQQSYCSDSNVYWITARRINSRLAFIVQKDDNTIILRQLFAPKDCPAWPSSKQ
jgi:hypothetical protein